MPKVGRNDPCPCGSGKKAKRCCIERIGTERLVDVLRGSRDQMAAKNERLKAERDELVMQLAAVEADREAEVLAAQVHALLGAGELEQAEAVGRELEEMFPGETEGIERLAQVYESREMSVEAARAIPARYSDDGRVGPRALLRLLSSAAGKGRAAPGP